MDKDTAKICSLGVMWAPLAAPLWLSWRPVEMIRILALTIALLGVWGCSPQNSDSTPPQASIEVSIDLERNELSGTMRLELEDGKPVTLALGPGFTITSTKAENAQAERLGPRGITIEPQQGAYAKISWSGTPMASAANLPAHIQQDSVLLTPASGWYPRISPQPFGYELTVTLPEQLQVVAEGDRGEESRSNGMRRVTFNHSEPAAGITVVGGDWQKESRQTQHGRVYTFFPEHLGQLSERYLEYTGEYFDTYSEWIGPAAHSSYSVVAAPLPVGLALAGFTYIGEEVLQLPFIPTTSLAHEVVHNWWGRGVYTDHSDGNWSEALTQYMGDYYQAQQRSKAEAKRMRGDWLRDQAALPEDMNYPLVNFRHKQSRIDDIVGYQRGAFLFHTLKRQFGDEVFTEAVRDFYQTHRHQWAGWHDLRHTFAETARRSGKDAEQVNDLFFWFLTTEQTPELRLTSATAHSLDQGYAVELELHWPEHAYPSLVPIVIHGAEARHQHEIALQPGQTKSATIKLEERPEKLEIDPDHHVYRQLARGERVNTLREIQLAEQVSLVKASEGSAEGLPSVARQVFKGEVDVRELNEAEGRAKLIVGSEADIEQALEDAQACIFRRSPPVAGETVAWSTTGGYGEPILALSADSAQSAQAALQRLERFGRHSYVGFNGRPETGLYEQAEQHALRLKLELTDD
ncbi:M1 family metallopeptidase [Halorhodospira halochloris]|uniref:M1 family metallopeptidase n=1 Tax=Halorhodospira halochloris TaxID=1052 RepID=UPI001EE80A1D|nr:M1 family aminopeptidase [Halorhodospira halochloris]MCG5547657.1 hypothetical protein [Halorhodospira halochloris]